jgi:5,10-methylenetetrahydromethanopterin reductase
MDYAIALAPGADAFRIIQKAEARGFTHAWLYDTQLLCADVFVALAAAAVQTSRIRLGPGVLIPSNRIAPVAASGFAALSKLAPGRIDFGIGTGFTGRRTMGLGGLPLATLREYVRVVRALLARETVEWEFEGARRKIRFLNPELGLIDTDHPIPVYVSAMGPRSRRFTAEIDAGWMNFMGSLPVAIEDARDMHTAWKEAGRDPAACYTIGFSCGCVLREGETADSPRAKAQAGPHAAVLLHNLMEASERGDLHLEASGAMSEVLERYRQVYERYEPRDARYLTLHRGHLLFLRPEEEPLVKGELIRDVTLTGTAAELRDRIRALEQGGYRQLAIQLVHGHEDALDDWCRVLDMV